MYEIVVALVAVVVVYLPTDKLNDNWSGFNYSQMFCGEWKIAKCELFWQGRNNNNTNTRSHIIVLSDRFINIK